MKDILKNDILLDPGGPLTEQLYPEGFDIDLRKLLDYCAIYHIDIEQLSDEQIQPFKIKHNI